MKRVEKADGEKRRQGSCVRSEKEHAHSRIQTPRILVLRLLDLLLQPPPSRRRMNQLPPPRTASSAHLTPTQHLQRTCGTDTTPLAQLDPAQPPPTAPPAVTAPPPHALPSAPPPQSMAACAASDSCSVRVICWGGCGVCGWAVCDELHRQGEGWGGWEGEREREGRRKGRKEGKLGGRQRNTKTRSRGQFHKMK